jgi:hypothetical protein
MYSLTPHQSNSDSETSVKVAWQLQENQILVSFKVEKSQINTSAEFLTDGWENSGLWEYDVVEVFIQFSDDLGLNSPYLELQVSPLGQKLALLINKPRVEVKSAGDLLSSAIAKRIGAGFEGIFKIDYCDIPGHENKKLDIIRAGFFACLGETENRKYFALNINTEVQPDFHRPELFKKIGTYER